MAARRDRDRRKPSGESRYRFATPETVVEADEAATNGDATQAAETPADRQARGRRATTADAPQAAPSTRGGARPAPLPFSAYAAEYRYVIGDLRRVGLVIGSLLVVLILLYLVLPH
jgi:hypothetical protein